MKLFFSPGSCSFCPHIVFREAGIPVELIKVNLKSHLLSDGSDFLAVNPKGYVPFLELDNGEYLSEGTAIIQYIADLKPESGLAPPPGSLERYRLQEWLGFINSEVHKGFSPFFKDYTPIEYKDALRKNLTKRLDFVAQHLKKQDFLLGNQLSVADVYLFTALGWAQWATLDLKDWPSLAAFRTRISERKSVSEAMAAEMAVD